MNRVKGKLLLPLYAAVIGVHWSRTVTVNLRPGFSISPPFTTVVPPMTVPLVN
jgi:hypothetical protein